MMTAPVDFSVLLSTRNRRPSLELVLSGLARQHLPSGLRWEVIVVDNGSSDGTAELLREWADRLPLRTLFEPEPGKYRAVNRGMECVTGSLVVFTDDDIVPNEHWVASLIAASERWPDHDVFGGVIRPRYPEDTPEWMKGAHYAGPLFSHFDLGTSEGPMTRTPFGPNMAVRRSAIQGRRHRVDLGPRGDGYPIGGETEFITRLIRAGHRCVYVPTAQVEHLVRPEQTEEAYAWHRASNFGRGLLKQCDHGPGVPRWFGAPLYLYRQLATSLSRWIVSAVRGDPVARRQAKWDTYLTRGAIHQARLDRPTRRPPP